MKIQPVRIGVVATTPLRLMGLAAILEDATRYEVLTLELEAACAEDDLEALLLDVHAPVDAIHYLVVRLREAQPRLKVLVMGTAIPLEDIQTLIGAGAKGFLLESSTESEIRMALEVVLDGSIWGPRKVLTRLLEAKASAPALPPVYAPLSEREIEVLNLLTSGRSNREIAAVLGVEEATVKAHMGRMLRKTQSGNRVELTLRALEEKKQREDS